MKIFGIFLCIFLLLFFPFWFVQFFALIILMVVCLSFLYSRILYYNIRITRDQRIVRSYKLQIIDIDFCVENRSIVPAHYLSVFESPGKLSAVSRKRFIFPLPQKQKKKLSYKVKGMVRGEYLLGPVVIKSGDPFGFFPWERRIKKECRVIIYPSVFKVKRNLTEGYPGGRIKVKDKMYEDVTSVKSIREYIPGDDIRHISWKISAHLGSLFTREFMQSLHAPALLILNLCQEDYPVRYRYTHMENAVEICASLVVYFSSLKQETGLISSGFVENTHPRIRLNGGHGHAMLLLETLALIKSSTSSVDIISLINKSGITCPDGTRLILIGPGLPDEQKEAFASMRKKRLLLEYIPISDKKIRDIHPGIRTLPLSEIRGEVMYV